MSLIAIGVQCRAVGIAALAAVMHGQKLLNSQNLFGRWPAASSEPV
jgi:hypothetical protein